MVRLAMAVCLLLPLVLGCAQIVGIEQDSYLIESDPGASSDHSATLPDGGSDSKPPNTPGQDAAVPVGHGPWCDNAYCDWSEDKESCPEDCKPYTCGNRVCEAGEDVSSCEADCGEPAVCGDTRCDPDLGEKSYNCADDCSS